MSSDLVDGNMKIFERIWKLVLKAEQWCQSNKTSVSDLKQVEKLDQDIFKIRNVQLSWVGLN